MMNEEYDWCYNIGGEGTEGPVDCVNGDLVVQTLKEVKSGKALDLHMYHRS